MLILDEPTAGLDPEQVAEVRRLIRSLRGERTVILSTHILPEVEATCDRVIIIHHGRILAVDTPRNLNQRAAAHLADSPRSPRRRRCRGRRLRAIPGVLACRRGHATLPTACAALIVTTEKDRDLRAELAAAIAAAQWPLLELASGRACPRRYLPQPGCRARAPTHGAPTMKFLVVCRRELRSYFGSYIAYILLAIFLLLSGYFFYSDLIFFVLFGGYVLPTGLWQYVFLDMRLCMLLVLPLLTMRLFAEEKKLGTIELLWTYPVRDGEIVFGEVPRLLDLLRHHAAAPRRSIRSSSITSTTSTLAPLLAALFRHLPARHRLHRLRAVHLVADREPGGQRHGHVRHPGVLLVSDLERGGRQPDASSRCCCTCRSSITSTTSRAA